MQSVASVIPQLIDSIHQNNNRVERTAAALKRLEDGVLAIQSSEDFKRFLLLASRFWDYSWRNWMLIACQCPVATHVAGYRTWQSLGRQVQKGQIGIKILAPVIRKIVDDEDAETTRLAGFRVVSVFDVSQTEGEALPTVHVPLLNGDLGAELYGRLAVLAGENKITLVDDKPIEKGAAGYWSPTQNEIHIDSSLSQLQKAKTLVHELAHALAGHGRNGDRAETGEAETIAESVAFVICDHFGLDTSERSFPYVARFAKDMDMFSRVMGEMQRVSKLILQHLPVNTSYVAP